MCYRCGGAAPSCEGSVKATVKCDDSSMPGSVFACQVYTVNFTSYNTIKEFKSKKLKVRDVLGGFQLGDGFFG